MEANKVDIPAFTVLRNFEQIQNTQEAGFARERQSSNPIAERSILLT
ncbi:MAG TPA: hypothetical protein VGK48_16945 [Terriglobia bacterium]